MKKKIYLPLLVLLVAILTAFTFGNEPNEILEIGAKAPLSDRKMMSTNDRMLSIADIKGENGALVIFSCNTCPFVVGNGKDSEGWEGRYSELQRVANNNGVGMILVNSNEAKRDNGDSMEDMKAHAKENAYRSHYVLDENHELADAFGALTTPHVFLFDKNMELVYKGAIDDNVGSAKDVKEHWLKDALNNLSKGAKIEPNSTRQLGCSIKRVKR
jgi:thioredoxin-related protein